MIIPRQWKHRVAGVRVYDETRKIGNKTFFNELTRNATRENQRYRKMLLV
jgi:hypothetical protein